MNYPTKIIENAINNNKLSHAYLFYGEIGVNLERVVLNSIKIIFEKLLKKEIAIDNINDLNYYDFKMIEPNNDGLIVKEKVNNAISNLYESSLTSDNLKILYIKDIDLGNKFSLNRLLKFIEEPVQNLIIFMSSNHYDRIISTIKSRTQNIYVKPETFTNKINNLKENIKSTNHLTLLANIYSNINEIKESDIEIFEKTYFEMMTIFEKSLDNSNYLKIELNKIWNKNNNNFVLNIMQFFYYQIQTKINDQFPLFPEYKELLLKYKTKNMNYFYIQSLIEKFRISIKSYANFNLQKSVFLLNLETIYKQK